MRATIIAFDAHRGDGVLCDDAGEELSFHCLAITDGSRHIEIGTRVTFVRRVGLLGRDEASEVQPLS